MPCDYYQLPHEGIQSLNPYVPGKSAASIKAKHSHDVIKLASNENPLGCSKQVIQALSELTPHQLATYTTNSDHALREILAKHIGVETDMVAMGNGSDTLFSLLFTCFALHTGRKILTHDYAFVTYKVQANTLGIPFVSTPIYPDWSVNIDAMIKVVDSENIGIICIANPNNPTGIAIPAGEIQRLLEHIPNSTILVLDEAYHEFHADNTYSMKLLKKYPNLVITRTFSKVYGLASLRLGYSIASPVITSLLYRIQLPFVVNAAVMQAAIAALDDQDFVKRTVALNEIGLKQVHDGLTDLGCPPLPSQGNFVMFEYVSDSMPLHRSLQDYGIIIRPLISMGLTQHFRVSIGTEEQNTRFLTTLKECQNAQRFNQQKM